VITPWLTETLRRLRQAGVGAEVLAPAYRGRPGGVVEGIPVHRFRYAPARFEDLTHDETAPDRIRRRPWYLLLVPGYVIAGMIAAWRLARDEAFDVVHVHWPIPHALFGLAARRAGGAALVSSFYGVELAWVRGQLRPLRPLLRHVIRTSDAVTAISSSTEAMVREVHDRAIIRIPFGAAVEPPDRVAAGDEAGGDEATGRGAAGGAAGGFDLLFAGRLVERKGIGNLLEAVALVRAERPVTLHIVGDGPDRRGLEAMASRLGIDGGVVFHGFLSRSELSRRFDACDGFVLPAVRDRKGDVEGLGVVLIEALRHGRPVIASAIGGIVDIVIDGETGLLVPPADARALARAITRLIEHPAERLALAAAGRAHVSREFGWPAIIERLQLLYRQARG
jgi:glycosyltransferase involved in cell wall biosynthesis